MLANWREITIGQLARRIGPVAELIVDDTLHKTGLLECEMVPSKYLEFLNRLYDELPNEVDRMIVCDHLRQAVLQRYGIPARRKLDS